MNIEPIVRRIGSKPDPARSSSSSKLNTDLLYGPQRRVGGGPSQASERVMGAEGLGHDPRLAELRRLPAVREVPAESNRRAGIN
jgi:hypothetical protein